MSYFVYGLFRPDNGQVFWIGASFRSKRLREDGRGKRRKITQAFRELGYSEIPSVVIRDQLSLEEAAAIEASLIEAIGCKPDGPLVNTHKSEGFGLASDTTRERMSQSAKARDRTGDWEQRRRARMADPDVREKMRLAKLGKPSAKKGKHYGTTERHISAQQGFGWFTNGVEEQRIKLTELAPDGWQRGRISGLPRTRNRNSS